MNTKKEKVLLGMSGGIDSTAAAILLIDKGYDVYGATFKVIEDEEAEKTIKEAEKICQKLNIKHYVFDYVNIFKELIIKDFVDKYKIGETPNPCVKCNKEIKYDEFLQSAKALGIDKIATGQYGRIEEKNNKFYIKKSLNKEKDQSYYLYNIKKENIKDILLPIGEIKTKEEAKEIASRSGIDFFQKNESQDICFINSESYGSFLNNYIDKDLEGNFIDKEKNILGKHKGIQHYTIGQRRGLNIALGTPHYVVNIDYKSKDITLGLKEDLYSQTCIVKDYNILNTDYDIEKEEFSGKVRYSHKEEKLTIKKENNHLIINFKNPVKAVTPGQSLVFYKDDYLIGGGIISL